MRLSPPARACPDCDTRGYQYCECAYPYSAEPGHPRQHDCLRCEGRASIPISCHQCEERAAVELLGVDRWLCRACADIDRELAAVIKRCACGAAHTPESWAHLRLVGIQRTGAVEALELRDCACGSTLARSVDKEAKP